ncbi:MAG TPA: RteC domain-containing protein [Pseudosphingobacterium sp.]|nr:RteC domain-containing protein [Pseudosphingobacterium sp.]
MINFSKKLEKQMNEGLAQAALETNSEMQKAERSFHVVETALLKLKDFIYEYQFSDKEEEIHFFKEIKPRFQSQMLFWLELIQIDSYNVSYTKKEQILYYRQIIERCKTYFEKNKLLYIYYKRKSVQEDDQLFLRQTDCIPLLPEYNLDMDRKFSTINSVRFAKFQAFEMVIDYLQGQINILKSIQPAESLADGFKSSLKWQHGSAALVETGRALWVSGAFGNASFKSVMEHLEFIGNYKVSNSYRIYTDMLIRKKDPTPYLKKITETLQTNMVNDIK